jgi:UDPglucose 6-dehydrogenase
MKICVFGLWHLGSVTAASLASVGHEVLGLDFDQGRIADLQLGHPPISEPGLEDLVKAGIEAKRLWFASSSAEVLPDTELLWVAFDTPVNDNDEADVDFVVNEVTKVIPSLPSGTTVLVSSQMPVGSIRRLEAIAQKLYPDKTFGFACSPENLRLGKALDVFLHPDRIVVGVRADRDRERIRHLLEPITDRVVWMSVESAEMTKHAINAFLATSVVFANEIASVCELVGADAKEVERGLKTETRIGPKAYLAPGGAFAGGTLARDIEFLKQAIRKDALAIPLLASVKVSNDEHKNWTRRRLSALLPNLAKSTVAVWGLTYKPGTDTLRRSLSVEICDWLLAEGANLCVHDPAVTHLPAHWGGKVQRFEQPLAAQHGVDALIVGTEWPAYKQAASDNVASFAPGLIVLDPNRFLAMLASQPQLRYFAVGTPRIEG